MVAAGESGNLEDRQRLIHTNERTVMKLFPFAKGERSNEKLLVCITIE